MQQWDAPLYSRLFLLFHWAKGTELPPRTANTASSEKGEKSLGATQKNLPDIRQLPKEALKHFQAGDWVEGWNWCQGEIILLWMKLGQCCKLQGIEKKTLRLCRLKGYKLPAGFLQSTEQWKIWRTNGTFKPGSHSAFPKLSVQPRQNTKISLQICSPYERKSYLQGYPTKIIAFYFSFSTSVSQWIMKFRGFDGSCTYLESTKAAWACWRRTGGLCRFWGG